MNLKNRSHRLQHVLQSAERNYRYEPNICAVSYGSKFINGYRLPGIEAVQFFVTEKVSNELLSKSLPKFIYRRRKNGALDRSAKVPTDVIELKNLELCCSAGDRLELVGRNGTITLIFSDAGRADNAARLLTCSHVVGDMSKTPPDVVDIVGGNSNCLLLANTVGNSVADNGYVEYDIAIADVSPTSDFFTPLQVGNAGNRLTEFLPAEEWMPEQTFSVVFPHSGTTEIKLASVESEFRDIHMGNGKTCTIGHLYACKGAAVHGDSGGIVFNGNQAVGMLIARADDDWVFIHALSEAVRYLGDQLGFDIRCF